MHTCRRFSQQNNGVFLDPRAPARAWAESAKPFAGAVTFRSGPADAPGQSPPPIFNPERPAADGVRRTLSAVLPTHFGPGTGSLEARCHCSRRFVSASHRSVSSHTRQQLVFCDRWSENRGQPDFMVHGTGGQSAHCRSRRGPASPQERW